MKFRKNRPINIIIAYIIQIVKEGYNNSMISAAALQILAIVTMTIDHIGYYLLPDCLPLRIIGRLAFPIFAFMLVEGFKHTHSRQKYFLRLLITAIISQIFVYLFAFRFGYSYPHNVVFSLTFALVTLICAEQGGFYIVAIPLLVLAVGAFECEYGIHGILLVLGIYYADRVFANNRFLRVAAQFIVLVATMSSLTMESGWVVQLYSLAAIVPIALYSGKKGRRLPRLFGYIYYPAHLAVFFLIKLLFF